MHQIAEGKIDHPEIAGKRQGGFRRSKVRTLSYPLFPGQHKGQNIGHLKASLKFCLFLTINAASVNY